MFPRHILSRRKLPIGVFDIFQKTPPLDLVVKANDYIDKSRSEISLRPDVESSIIFLHLPQSRRVFFSTLVIMAGLYTASEDS